MTTLNTTTASSSSTQLSVERQLAELIDEVRASVGSQATEAAKMSFNPKEILTKFNNLIDKAINNIKEEHDQAIANRSSQTIIDSLNQQLELVEERATTFQNYLNDLASDKLRARSMDGGQSNALSAWLDEVSPLAEPEDFTEMPFQSLKADPNNVPRDFSTENTSDINIKTRALKNLDDFFLPEYLASTNETEITDDILAQAKELGNSPVKIYEWVCNNIEWQPTWGGQQTADMTLDVRRGNAMDISTLMIALLRAAKIPARYVHGTVDIPVDDFINMAGDFEAVETAMDFVSASGVPVTSVIIGGKIAKVRIEHVWVEAAVPFYPSRGSKPVSARNPIDSWIPLDGSFKQYEYSHGLDLEAIANLNGEQVASNLINSSNINEEEGWIQGFNKDIIDQAQIDVQINLVNTVNTMQSPAVGDITGGRKIIKQKFSMLPGSLPYLSVVRGVSYTQLSHSLQVLVTLGLGYDRYMGEYQQQQTWPLYQLNQRNITICFKPASEDDKNILESLIPNGIEGQTQLSSFLPSTIKVIPEIKRDSEVLLTSSLLALGEKVDVGFSFQTPTRKSLSKRDQIIAGSYLALGVVGSNPSKKIFEKLKVNLKDTKQIMESDNDSRIKLLTREKVFGDVFVTGIQNYYTQYIAQSHILSLQEKVMYQAIPMAGTFGYEPYQRTLFGLNRGIESHGMYMNVQAVQALQDKNGDAKRSKQFMLRLGTLSSSLEHIIPEQMFNKPSETVKIDGFSAVRALNMAMLNKQKIYIINQHNKNNILQALHLDSLAMEEIRNALATGKEVITHTDQFSIPGFKGNGYVILDPITGEGAYKISGGKNGAFFAIGNIYGSITGFTIGLFDVGLSNKATAAWMEPILIALALELASIAIIWAAYGLLYGKEAQRCFVLGLTAGLIAGGLTASILAKVGSFSGGAFTTTLMNTLLSVFTFLEGGGDLSACI